MRSAGRGGGADGGALGGGGSAPVPPPPPVDEDALEAQMEAADQIARAQRRAAEVERKRFESEASARVKGASEFQELVAYVLEGTLFNLVSEISLGEFPLDTVPRQIVRSLEITQDAEVS